MYSFITDHIYANNYFSNFQHGFMKGRSTTPQLLEIMDHWTESFDLDTQIDCIYLDFKKAFDSVLELGITRLHDELDGLIRLTVSLP